MTDLPSYELVQRFMHEAGFPIADPNDEMVFPETKLMKLASRLIQHGADQELEACCKWLPKLPPWSANDLRKHRRPKPPSDKELALEALHRVQDLYPDLNNKAVIRRALEQLPDAL